MCVCFISVVLFWFVSASACLIFLDRYGAVEISFIIIMSCDRWHMRPGVSVALSSSAAVHCCLMYLTKRCGPRPLPHINHPGKRGEHRTPLSKDLFLFSLVL